MKTVQFSFGVLVGSIMGLCIALWLESETRYAANEAYELGRKTAQKECVELIKNTK